MKVYGIKNCETVKKALTVLENKGISFEFHDYKKLGISTEKIDEWLKVVELEKLINKKGTTYKKLSDDEKLSLEKEKTAKNVMIKYTSVIKRPILETKNQLIVGFDITEYNNIKK